MHRLTGLEKLRLDEVALRAVSQGVVITGADRRILWVNSAFETITGFSEEDAIGCNCSFLQGSGTDPKSIDDIRRTLNNGDEYSGEVQNYRKDGQSFWNELTITPARDPQGLVTHFVGVCRDVTERVNAREALLEREKLARQKSGELSMVLGSMSQGISSFDQRGRLTVWNPQYLEMFGIDPGDVEAGTSLIKLLELQKAQGKFNGEPEAFQRLILERTAAGLHYKSTANLISGRVIASTSAPGLDGGWVSTHEDITEQYQRSENLAEATRQLAIALYSMRQGLAMFDADRRLVVWNHRYCELIGLRQEELKPRMSLNEILAARVRAGSFTGDISNAMVRESDALRVAETFETLDFTADGRVLSAFVKGLETNGFVVTYDDITEQRRIKAQIEHDALHDALTGLPNRRLLDRVLVQRERDSHASGEGVALLHIDLDHFKQINDTLGHEAGDAMLVQAALVLKSSVHHADFVSRSGGDEFVVVCRPGKDPRRLGRLADRIVRQMCKPVIYHEHECRFGVSIGIAHQTGKRVDAKKLLINADIALYEAKRHGRNRHQFFTPAMQLAVTRTKQLADELHAAIENKEFVAFFQPQVDARTLKMSGVEALVRWNHPTRGLLSPDKFLKIADEMGIVGTIDGMVLQQALAHFDRWKTMRLGVPRVSVNVSAKRLRDSNLIKSLQRLQIAPGTISFELLESIYLDETDDIVAWNIDQIRELGIDIEVDDFGTGHTSILSLLKLNPQRLKIDRQLVAPIVGSPQHQQLVRTMVELGHSLGIRVIAEGIETLEHAAIAEGLGCDELQGYAFSRPLSAKDFEGFARSFEAGVYAAKGWSAQRR